MSPGNGQGSFAAGAVHDHEPPQRQERDELHLRLVVLLASAGLAAVSPAVAAPSPARLDAIETIVVIYAENRSFDNLYGYFPGANGLQHLTPAMFMQRDRDGAVLRELPPIWGGLTAKGVRSAIPEDATRHLPNRPFAIDDAKGFDMPLSVVTRDLWHLFYEHQMQLDGGRNDKFVAFANSGALVMGHYQGMPARCRCGRSRGSTRSPTISSWAPSAAPSSTISG